MPKFTEVGNSIIKKYISDPELSDSLADIRKVMESIWRTEVRLVKNYTDHGVEHSERIAGFAEKLLEINPNVKFSEQEIYLLLAGIYLHDIGMQCDVVKYLEIKKRAEDLGAKFNMEFCAKTTNEYTPEQQNEIRKNHHYLSAAWIDYLYEGNDPTLSPSIRSIPNDLVDDLIDICKFHSKLPINDCPDNFNHCPNNRKKMVAALLRFADELDITSSRVDLKTVKIFAMKPNNSVYWWLHNCTNINFIDSNKIRVTVRLHPEDFESYGSFIRTDYILRFKNKNLPVLEVLIGQNIPVVIDYNSNVVAHKRAEKLPPEITAVFNMKLKKLNFDEKKKPKVLIVDDMKENVELMEAYLSVEPYEVVCSYSGKEAFQKVKEEKPDIVLLDVMMPEVNGYEVCKILKENPETQFIPILMLTALSGLEDRIKGIEAGADDFLTKPINRLELKTRVKSLLKVKYRHDRLVADLNILEVENRVQSILTTEKK